ALIDVGVIRVQEIDDAAILTERACEPELSFLPHRLTQILVPVRERRRIGLYCRYVTQEQPLAGEVLHQSLRALIRHHALHLALKDVRLAELSALGSGEHLVVGNAAQQEERRARRKLDVGEGATAAGGRTRRILPHGKNEVGRYQVLLQRKSPPRQNPAGLGALLVEGHELRQILR